MEDFKQTKEYKEWKEEIKKMRETYIKVVSCLATVSSGLSALNTQLQDTTLLLSDHVEYIKKSIEEV